MALRRSLSAFLALCQDVTATSVKIYDAQPTPVQLLKDERTGETTYHVHLYILVDAEDPTSVVQGGAFYRWRGSQEWLPAPAPLYDEHQVDPVEAGTTIRGYNIVWGQSLGHTAAPADAMEFRVWAMADGDAAPAEAIASKPVEKVDLSEEKGDAGKLDVFLFGAKAFQATADDGIHVHFVINVWPPQPAIGPNYQLFSELQLGDSAQVRADAPSRFEHTYDAVTPDYGSKAKTCSRYNLSWRLPKELTLDACRENASGKARVTAKSFDGAIGQLEFPLTVDCVAAAAAMV